MERIFEYTPLGVCSSKMSIVIDDENDKIIDFNVIGGCPGNLSGIRKLIIGMSVKEVQEKLSGVTCGRKSTSCPDQLSKALKAYLDSKAN